MSTSEAGSPPPAPGNFREGVQRPDRRIHGLEWCAERRLQAFSRLNLILERDPPTSRKLPPPCLHRLGRRASRQQYLVICLSNESRLSRPLDYATHPLDITSLEMLSTSQSLSLPTSIAHRRPGLKHFFQQAYALLAVMYVSPDSKDINRAALLSPAEPALSVQLNVVMSPTCHE